MDTPDIFEKKSLSLWLKDGLSSQIPQLEDDIACDVCVVGAGITGITTAYCLQQSGLKTVLIDKAEPINLASGNTTAKFTFQHSLIYSEILKKYGLNQAKLYYEAQLEGLDFVRSLIAKHQIACDFKETSAVVYTQEQDEKYDEILAEKSAYDKLNIPHELIYDLPFGLKGRGGLKVPNQFELNPVKYLDFLLSWLMENGVSVFKNTEAKSIEKDEENINIKIAGGQTIKCSQAVIATAYPFFEGDGLYFTRLEASRSYLTAFPSKESLEDGYMMITNSDSPYSLRLSQTDGTSYLLVGGEGHPVGQADSEMDNYQRLIDFAKAHFDVEAPAFRWSAQDYKTVDKIPYIGLLTSKEKNIYVATGFNKWGMSNGSFAGLLISDMINGDESRYEELFKPSRGEVKGNLGSFIKANLNVAKEMIKGKVLQDEIDLEDIKNDEGGIIKLDGKRVAAYRDQNGELFLWDSTCTHLGCELEYNNAERSFDCPCHGCRFNYDGKVIEGPAKEDLKIVEK